MEPEFAFAYDTRGSVYNNIQDYSKAISDFTKAIELNSNYAIAYFNRGNAYYNSGDNIKAREDWQKAYSLGYIEE